MSGSLTVIGGHSASHPLSGLVSVPSNFPIDINTILQTSLTMESGAVSAGVVGLINYNAVTGLYGTSVTGLGTVYEITNTDSVGAVSPGSVSGSFTIPAGINNLIVEAPGNETIVAAPSGGPGTTSFALFGASSNVDYSVVDGAGSIYAAGGNDSISIGSGSTGFDSSVGYTVYTAGNDTINLVNGMDSVDATGNASTTMFVGAADGFVTADGSSTVSVVFQPLTSGNLNFVNNTNDAATVYTGAYTLPGGGTEYAHNQVTAFGGAGGGFFVGGLGGNNSLIGGNGVVTLQGGGEGDVLSVSGGTGNQLFSGPGAETLIGGTGSGANTFQLNLKYVGIGTITGADVVSTEGSGQQSFLLGAGDSTLTGSSASGASNIFDLIRNSSIGSANYTITNFASINGTMFITDPNLTTGSSSVFSVSTADLPSGEVTTVTLTDSTEIKFAGLGSADLKIATDSTTGIISINHT